MISVKGFRNFGSLLQEAESRNVLVVCAFSAESWCKPCKQLKPYLVKYANDYKDKVVFLHIDHDYKRNKCIFDEFGVSAMPSLLFFRGQDEIHKRYRLEGFDESSTCSRLKKRIERFC